MGLAFLGGILLNLMPCVFPVLSLKVVSLTGHASERHWLRVGGVAYTAGVVSSFVLLAALLLGLRAGGTQLGWGFQLQSPEFVAGLTLLFTVIGLNLFGVFEFRAVLPGNLAGMRAAHPAVDSFLTGVLAVAVASPCTAPFMGVALGAALTLPAWQALAVFACVGLGMAAPYLLMTWWPALSRLLPRPGVWMQHFKVAMAFPMFATVIWLLWVLGQQVGIDGVAALLGLLLAVSLLAWVWGAQDFGPRSRWVARALALVLAAITAAWALPALQERAGTPPVVAAAAAGWQPWSPQAVERALGDGHPVFVDFTAAWCVTCQFNKRGALGDAGVMADFRARGVVLMRADWTRHDPEISAELSRLGRSGVPVYLLLKPGGQPRLLPELLNPAALREALAEL
jgi:thiol:disulfide interchange protein DsbD